MPRPVQAGGAMSLAPLLSRMQAQLGAQQAQLTELRALRGDVAGGGYDAIIAAGVQQLVDVAKSGAGPATTAQGARYRSALGALA